MLHWDRSHQYVLHRFFHEVASLVVRCPGEHWTPKDIMALRQCVPELKHLPPGILKARLQDSVAMTLEQMPALMARQFATNLTTRGLRVEFRDESHVGYLPEDKTTGYAWLIEDDDEAKAVAESMIAAGVPIVDAYGS